MIAKKWIKKPKKPERNQQNRKKKRKISATENIFSGLAHAYCAVSLTVGDNERWIGNVYIFETSYTTPYQSKYYDVAQRDHHLGRPHWRQSLVRAKVFYILYSYFILFSCEVSVTVGCVFVTYQNTFFMWTCFKVQNNRNLFNIFEKTNDTL